MFTIWRSVAAVEVDDAWVNLGGHVATLPRPSPCFEGSAFRMRINYLVNSKLTVNFGSTLLMMPA